MKEFIKTIFSSQNLTKALFLTACLDSSLTESDFSFLRSIFADKEEHGIAEEVELKKAS